MKNKAFTQCLQNYKYVGGSSTMNKGDDMMMLVMTA